MVAIQIGQTSEAMLGADERDVFLHLAGRLRDGDVSALEELWSRYGDDLRRRARTRLRQFGISGYAESMDICNGVMLDLLRQRDIKIRNPADLIGYVRIAIDNQVRDALKSLMRDCRDFRRVDSQPVERHDLLSSETTPSVRLIRTEVLDRVRSELGDRHMLVEMVIENRNWHEIGRELGIDPDTARMCWRRALDRVRREFGVVDE